MAPRPGRNTTWSRWRRVRQIVQVLFFILFVYLLFAALQRRAAFPLADLFFRLDPLAALGVVIAGRDWVPRLALALLTVGLTIVLGRVWCGWICPLGSLLDWISFPGARKRAAGLSPGWRGIKYFLLFLILAGALFGSLTLMIFDPLTLITRAMTTVILPALNFAFNGAVRLLYPIRPLQGLLSGLEGFVRGPILPVKQPVFANNALIAFLFTFVIAANVFAARFWCRYLCPLGALLGLLSKISLLRPVIGPACVQCGRCDKACPVDAIDEQDWHVVASECTLCLDCLAVCPHSAINFQPGLRLPAAGRQGNASPDLAAWPAPSEPYDPTRRQVLAALATGAAGVLVMRTGLQASYSDPHMVRPPGVNDEAEFLARCLRCSQCMKVCPTSGLQPSLWEAGLEGMWTPRLVPRVGYCSYGCNACGQICPSQAIPSLDLADKRQAVMGVSAIDRNRCLPWAQATPCIVCEEMCPVPDKAIRLEEVTLTDDRGQQVTVQRPYVVNELCIGCGICEYQCPIVGEAAIRVFRF